MMNYQEIIVIAIFAGAIFYIARRAYLNLTEKGCNTGCPSCEVVDLAKNNKHNISKS